MALILAIEPNKGQAQQIAALVKQHLRGAELVAAASADEALAAVRDRIPDLILTPALLPSKDEAALTEWLRRLGPAASHIQTLAVPIISSGRSRHRDAAGGILGRKKERDAASQVGCEPDIFAEQMKVYLDRAAHDRAALDDAGGAAPHVAIDAQPDPAAPDASDVDVFDQFDWLPDEPPAPPAPAVIGEPDTPAEPVSTAPEPLRGPQDTLVAPPPVDKRKTRKENAIMRAYEEELGLPPSRSTSPPLWRVTEEGIDQVVVEDEPEPEPEPAAVIAAQAPDTVELPPPVEALPTSVHEPPAGVDGAPAVEPAVTHKAVGDLPAAAPPPAKARAKGAKARKAAAPPDEWGSFDPHQSPFKALVKRLDEIAGREAPAR